MNSDSNGNDKDDTRYYATSKAIERLISSLNRRLPINLDFLTVPCCQASVSRVRSLESMYAHSRVLKFLMRQGVHPSLVFLSSSASLVFLLRRCYMRSTSLFIAVLGVAYPAWRCWHLVKQHENEQTIEHLQDCKGWVTYWIIFGILHVLDNWNPQLLSMFPNYNLYKIALLYWAQSPHSKGASILHRHVLQKPEQSTNPPPAPHPQPSHTSPFPRKPSLYDADDLTLTIERRSMRLLDGYIPSLDLSGSSRNHSRQSSVNGHIVTPENEEIHEPSKTAQFPMAISADEATW